MTTILVTGGTGTLGRLLVDQLHRAGYRVRRLSRRAPDVGQETGVEWVQADLATGRGLGDAVAGVQTLIHAATSPRAGSKVVDIGGTRRLLDQARAAGVRHVIYPSIVGVERVPLAYYRHKLAAEALVVASGLPWTIVRATQFHPFVDGLLRSAARLPVLLLPTDFRFQPIDPAEVAARLVEVAAGGPAGRLPDIGGPVVQTLGDLAATWLAVHGRRRPVLRLSLPGAVAAGFRSGGTTCPAHRVGRITWAAWLEGQLADPAVSHGS